MLGGSSPSQERESATSVPTPGGQTSNDSTAEERRHRGATWRAVAIAVLVMPLQSWWIVQMEVIRYNTWPTMLSLPLHTVFILLLLVGVNALVKRRKPQSALSQGEMLTAYIMLAIAGVIAGYGLVQALVGWIIAPLGRTTAGYDWRPLFLDVLPRWLVVTDESTLAHFYDGESTFLTRKHLLDWGVPTLAWSCFMLAFFGAMLSLNALLRRRWVEEERLTFPLVQLPLAVTEPSGSLFRCRLVWIGFAMAVVLGSVNGLHTLFPAVPSLQPDMNSLNENLGRRWSCFLKYGGSFWPPYFWALGIGFLMPVDITFSYWFFFWLVKLEELLTAAWGWDIAPDAPFTHQQSASALVAVGLFVLWSGRRSLARAIRQALRPSVARRDEEEPLRYRWALGLLVLSVAGMAAFVRLAGAPVWIVFTYLGLYLVASLALSRLRAELGAPQTEVYAAGPYTLLTQLVTPASFPFRGLAILTLLGWTSKAYGMDATPLQMEGFKMLQAARVRSRGLVVAMFVAAIAGLVSGYLALLMPLYSLGADSAKVGFEGPTEAYAALISWTTGVAPAPLQRGFAMGVAFVFTFLLYALRSRFFWWPFHPMGYVLAPMWFTHHLWMSVFVAWTIKALILRYGGLRTYAKALPFFLGLILGDCAIGSIWALLNLLFGIPSFSVWI